MTQTDSIGVIACPLARQRPSAAERASPFGLVSICFAPRLKSPIVDCVLGNMEHATVMTSAKE
jgi:hypothetical protein